MLIVNFCVPTILLTSVACTVNVDGPAVFGVPVIAPLLGSIPKPSGKAPVTINHVQQGVLPSVALRLPEYAQNASPSGSDPDITGPGFFPPSAAAPNTNISTSAPDNLRN